MVSPQIKFVVLGHHSRRRQAESLADLLNAHLLVDEGNHGANWNHRRALEWAAKQSCRVVVLEDDALPVSGFTDKISVWIDRFPEDLCSFYLGTGRPPQWQPVIAEKLASGGDYIVLPTLIHGVCYSIPPASIPEMLNKLLPHWAADYAIGRAWGGDVIYLAESLVEHADGETVERHHDGQPRTERRRAWKLAG